MPQGQETKQMYPIHLRALWHFGHFTHYLFLAKFNENYHEKKHNLNNI